MNKSIQMVKSGGTWVARKAKNKSKVLAAAGSALMISGGAFAADYTSQISTASTDGSANVTAVIAAVIGIAILGFGVGSMMGWFKK